MEAIFPLLTTFRKGSLTGTSSEKGDIDKIIIAFTGYNVYQSQKADASLSDLAMANVEALANGELSNGNCEGSWSQECCKCDYIHYTYACAIEVTGNSCYTVSGCSHYTN